MSFGQWASDYLGVPLEERFNFNPLTYFLYSGIDGAWFDPEDISTMFQDSAGTTPVTALEQPVGLWLDKSKGMGLGPEIVTNGDFSNGITGWIGVGGSISAVDGKAVLTTDGSLSFPQIYQNISTIPVGIPLRISWSVSNNTTTRQFKALIFNTTDSVIVYDSGSVNTSGDFTSIWVAGASLNKSYRLIVIANSSVSAGLSATFDNISVRELKGNHATQSITASRPTLSARYNQLLNSATLSTQSVTTVAAQYTLSFTGTGSVTLSGTATGTLAGTGANNRVSLSFTPTAGTLTLTVTGSVTLTMLALGTMTTYQAITTATSYDSVGWPKYLKSDGIDDFYNLPFMNLYGNGTCSIVAARDAVSKTTDTYIISERSTTDAYPKYFPSRQLASGGNMDSYIVSNEGTVRLDTTGSAFSGAKLAAIRSVVDSGSNIKLFKDGAVVADDNYTRAGELTLNNTTIGASVSTTTSAYANMRLYGLIITKSALSDTDRRRCEHFLASRLSTLGVTLS